ncbi:MAG: Flp pilus assembly complex ATPase component TadA [Candidatus Schekmanbacteria bacterium]|nr:Flp pilus assembly complex ATPase component TadA [Candidatus Schekmanbacteria bacterium]
MELDNCFINRDDSYVRYVNIRARGDEETFSQFFYGKACKQMVPAKTKLKLGEILVKEKIIKEEELQRLLILQKESTEHLPIGEICIAEGLITRHELKNIIKQYGKEMRIGELFTSMGLINEKQVGEALQKQKVLNKKLGETLVEMGCINEENLIMALSHQLDIPRIKPDPLLIEASLLNSFNRKFLETNYFIPVFNDENNVTIAMADPLDENLIISIKSTIKDNVIVGIASKEEILFAIKNVYEKVHLKDLGSFNGSESSSLSKSQLTIGNVDLSRGDDKIVSVVNYIISNGVKEGASDIHIEPQQNRLRIRYRIDGVMVHKTDLPSSIAPNVASRIKAVCQLDISEKRRHQDGKIYANVMGKEIDLRVSTYASVYGETIVIRILHRQSSLIDIESLGLSPINLSRFRKIVDSPTGVILATGPTGSGKTTSLYAVLCYLNKKNYSIITVEDPVEYMIDGVVQGKLDPKLGMSYMDFLKSMMRQDPDVLMVGEVRDKVAAEATIQAALTGHKVLSSFHTDDSTSALLRLMDMGIETFLISSTIVSVMSQRLVRTICGYCKVEDTDLDPEVLASFHISPDDAQNHKFYKGKGCDKCNHTGFKGRTAIHELLVLNDSIRDAILQRMPSSEIRHIARQAAELISLREDGIYKSLKGITTLKEINRVVFQMESDKYKARTLDQLIEVCNSEYVETYGVNKNIPAANISKPVSISSEAQAGKNKTEPITSVPADVSAPAYASVPDGTGMEVFRLRIKTSAVEDEFDLFKDLYDNYIDNRRFCGLPDSAIEAGDFIEVLVFYIMRLKLRYSAKYVEVVITRDKGHVDLYLETFARRPVIVKDRDVEEKINITYSKMTERVDFDEFLKICHKQTTPPLSLSA